MGRSDLERLSREELIELVLRLQRPEKTSRTSSKPPATDRKERREQARPGGAKPGHEGHSRVMSDDPDAVVDHRADRCSCCGGDLHAALPTEVVSTSERIELPQVTPVVTQHRRLAVRCPSCGTRVVAAVPEAARGTPFGPRLHAVATYLKTFQALMLLCLSSGRELGRLVVFAAAEMAEDLACHVPLQASDDFPLRPALSEALCDVG